MLATAGFLSPERGWARKSSPGNRLALEGGCVELGAVRGICERWVLVGGLLSSQGLGLKKRGTKKGSTESRAGLGGCEQITAVITAHYPSKLGFRNLPLKSKFPGT